MATKTKKTGQSAARRNSAEAAKAAKSRGLIKARLSKVESELGLLEILMKSLRDEVVEILLGRSGEAAEDQS